MLGTREQVRAQWRSRPLPLRIYVGMSLGFALLSLVREPEQLAFPWVILTLLSLVLLKMLWDGSPGMWWLSVLALGAAAALSLSAVSERPSAWVDFAVRAFSLMLLVHGSTRAWFNERIAERYR